jgi:ABC-type sugar transport system permease subunit
MLFSTIILLLSGTIGVIFYHPSVEYAAVGFFETFFVVLTLAAVALAVGFKGPDFSVTRRARMIRQEWSLIGLIVCGVAGLAVVAPLGAIAIFSFFGGGISTTNLTIAVAISAVISIVISAIFYRINIGLANDLLKKAQI